MGRSTAVNNLVSYYPKKGKGKELLTLIQKHWPTLKRIGLATDLEAKIWKATDVNSGEEYFVEFFQWVNSECPDIAHQTPEVLAIWEPMVTVLDMEKFKIAEIDLLEE